jgi:hypothetical protein
MLKGNGAFMHKFPNGQQDTISQNELLTHLIDSTEVVQKVQKASAFHFPSPPHSVTRDLPNNDVESITGQWPIALRQQIIQNVISFTQLLLKEGQLLFEAIDRSIAIEVSEALAED